MSDLVDVDLLIACTHRSHLRYREASLWLAAQSEFFTCPVTELGYLRTSMCPAYQYDFPTSLILLKKLRSLPSHRFISDSLSAVELPELVGRHMTSDAYLVMLAARHGLRLATLDQELCLAPWAAGIAVHPLPAAV